MLTSLILLIAWVILLVIQTILAQIPIALPANIAAAFMQFGSYLGYARGIVDVNGVFGAFIFLLNFMIGWFTFKLVLMLYHMIAARRVHDSHALPAQKKK